ncbi:hypothetical protein SAMN05216483_0543 [Streptomyces sp. 2131.1]|uniref:hypothetical protein n=1 Tax=Streptomyces sp. 2131.1 TaxID=1855346 RepID=UPI000898B3A3|nr:hypothetical protein [Streptomyces sp. 2131.1]SEB84337.1 hypothetical protein SAMN05216483_0543 [Streptomyces sp. 2131.1]
MRSIRVTGALALLALVAACGGNAPAPAPSPSASPPVSVSLEDIGTPGDTRLGLALHLHNEARTRPGIVVRVHIGKTRGGDPRPELEERTDAGWKDIALTGDKDGWTGTFRMTLPKGGLLGFLDVTPHAGPRVDGDELPVDVTLADGARTLARGHGSVRPAALSLDRAVVDEPAALGRGRWTEVTYTVVNHSHSVYPRAQVQGEFGACEAGPDNPVEGVICSGSRRHAVTTWLSTQWYDGGRWTDVSAPDDGTLLAETLTMPLGELPADSRRKVRNRFAGIGELDGGEHLLTLTARVNGKALGASERSLGIAEPLTFALR